MGKMEEAGSGKLLLVLLMLASVGEPTLLLPPREWMLLPLLFSLARRGVPVEETGGGNASNGKGRGGSGTCMQKGRGGMRAGCWRQTEARHNRPTGGSVDNDLGACCCCWW